MNDCATKPPTSTTRAATRSRTPRGRRVRRAARRRSDASHVTCGFASSSPKTVTSSLRARVDAGRGARASRPAGTTNGARKTTSRSSTGRVSGGGRARRGQLEKARPGDDRLRRRGPRARRRATCFWRAKLGREERRVRAVSVETRSRSGCGPARRAADRARARRRDEVDRHADLVPRAPVDRHGVRPAARAARAWAKASRNALAAV